MKLHPSRATGLTMLYVAVSVALAAGRSDAATALSYAGRLVQEDGRPRSGVVDLELTFHAAASGPATLIDPIVLTSVTLVDGVFQVDLPLSPEQLALLFADGSATVYVAVKDKTSGVTYPRQRLEAVPVALRTPVDARVLSYDEQTGLLRLAAQPTAADAGKVLSARADGTLEWGSVAGTGTVTSVAATAPLSVSNASSTPTIELPRATASVDGYVAATDFASFAATSANAVRRDGSVAMGGPLAMGGHAVVGLAAPTAAGDAATKGYVDTALAGKQNVLGTASASSNGILSAIDWSAFDAAGALAATAVQRDGSVAMTGDLAMGSHRITGVAAPTAASDATTKSYVDAGLAAKQATLGFTPLDKAGDGMLGPLGLRSYSDAEEAAIVGDLSAADEGKAWSNGDTNQTRYWDGATAVALGVSGAGLTNLNGLAGSTQTFAIGSGGTAPAIGSAGSTHTLSIPMASAAGVTAGLISRTDYDAFVAGATAAGTAVQRNGSVAMTGSLPMGGSKVTGLGAPTDPADAATKAYVDALSLGEVNTASNVGTAGVGVFKQKTGVDLELKKLNAGSTKITVVDDTAASEVKIDLVEANVAINSLSGTLGVAKGGTGATTAAGARASLELGTAATLSVGTSAGNVVQLNGSGYLPALDARNLTNVPGGSTLRASDGTPADAVSVDAVGNVAIGSGGAAGADTRLNVSGGALTIGTVANADASLHVVGATGGFGRLTQLSPTGASQPALNLMGSTNASSVDQWWSWGVQSNNTWRIQPGSGGFSGTTGLTIDTALAAGVTVNGATAPLDVSHTAGAPLGVFQTSGTYAGVSLRSETDGGGAGTQNWQLVSGMGGNTRDFVIEDITGGRSTTSSPFRIGAGANASILMNPAGGNVGIGVTAASSHLHVEANKDSREEILFRNTHAGTSAHTLLALRNDHATAGLVMFLNSGGRTTDGGVNAATIRNDIGKLNIGSSSGTNAITVGADGNVGFGATTMTPVAKIDVAGGQILSRVYNAGSSTAIDWNNGNVQYTSTNTAAKTFTNMQDGGSYTLVCTGTTSVTRTFSQAGLTFKFVPANGPTVAGKETVYTFIRAGATVYVSWVTGF